MEILTSELCFKSKVCNSETLLGLQCSKLRCCNVELKCDLAGERRLLEDIPLLVSKPRLCHCWINQSPIEVALTCWEMSAFSVKAAEPSLGAALLSLMLWAPKKVLWCLADDLPQEHKYTTNAEMLFIDTFDRNLIYCASLYCGMENWQNEVVTFLPPSWSNGLMLAGPRPGAPRLQWDFT